MKRVIRCNLNFTNARGDEILQEREVETRYVGPYEILQRVGKVSFELILPNDLASVHPLFYISVHKKCISDSESILPIEDRVIDENLSYKEVSVEIIDTQVKNLRNKEVASVKVVWKNHLVEGAT